MRASSPAPSATGSISGFTFESNAPATSTSSITSTTRVRPNFWDFEAYSRAFLNEKKAIEREKEEWGVKVKERTLLLNKSIDFYLAKYQKLKNKSKHCTELLQNNSDTFDIENEINQLYQRVDQLKCLINYCNQVEGVLSEIEVEKEEEFKTQLLKQNWKFCLENLLKLISSSSINTEHSVINTKFLNEMKWSIIKGRITLFHGTIGKVIKKHVDGLGWPKIISNEETAEIISRLQELLTYSEALYLLVKNTRELNESTDDSVDFDVDEISLHPLHYFSDPIKLRFEYHFNSDRPTNQLDKPEWFFDNLMATCRENVNFLREFIFPCWRLRDLNDFLSDCPIQLAKEKTKTSLESFDSDCGNMIIHYLLEFGKFLNCLRDEFGFIEIDGIIEDVFVSDSFIQNELDRVKEEYSKLFNDMKDSDDDQGWTPVNRQIGEPSPIVLKFLSFFHSSLIVPYSFIKKNLKVRSLLLYRVQSWVLETFHDKCQFECSPLHTGKENILKDIWMINSFSVICKVLENDFGESIDYLELSASEELHDIIGYDPSELPGTCFNKAVKAFKTLSDRLLSYVFNYAMDRFLKPATSYSNSMIYANVQGDDSISIPEDLRVAMSNLNESYKFIREFLDERQFTKYFTQILPTKIASFMFQGVLLKNFFSENGANRFEQDLLYVQDSLCHMDGVDPGHVRETFNKLTESVELLKIKERDPTSPFDGHRLARSIRENRQEELKRILEMLRIVHLKVEELPQVFASRRH